MFFGPIHCHFTSLNGEAAAIVSCCAKPFSLSAGSVLTTTWDRGGSGRLRGQMDEADAGDRQDDRGRQDGSDASASETRCHEASRSDDTDTPAALE